MRLLFAWVLLLFVVFSGCKEQGNTPSSQGASGTAAETQDESGTDAPGTSTTEYEGYYQYVSEQEGITNTFTFENSVNGLSVILDREGRQVTCTIAMKGEKIGGKVVVRYAGSARGVQCLAYDELLSALPNGECLTLEHDGENVRVVSAAPVFEELNGAVFMPTTLH